LTLPAVGTRGGILIAWKGAVCQVISSHIDNSFRNFLISELSTVVLGC
jgi:hypothetical protein